MMAARINRSRAGNAAVFAVTQRRVKYACAANMRNPSGVDARNVRRVHACGTIDSGAKVCTRRLLMRRVCSAVRMRTICTRVHREKIMVARAGNDYRARRVNAAAVNVAARARTRARSMRSGTSRKDVRAARCAVCKENAAAKCVKCACVQVCVQIAVRQRAAIDAMIKIEMTICAT